MTLEEAATQCETHYSQVSKIERGMFRRLNGNVQLLCQFLEVDPDEPSGLTSDSLHARLEALIRDRPQVAVAMRALFDAFERMST